MFSDAGHNCVDTRERMNPRCPYSVVRIIGHRPDRPLVRQGNRILTGPSFGELLCSSIWEAVCIGISFRFNSRDSKCDCPDWFDRWTGATCRAEEADSCSEIWSTPRPFTPSSPPWPGRQTLWDGIWNRSTLREGRRGTSGTSMGMRSVNPDAFGILHRGPVTWPFFLEW